MLTLPVYNPCKLILQIISRILETETRINHRGLKTVAVQISAVAPCIALKLSG